MNRAQKILETLQGHKIEEVRPGLKKALKYGALAAGVATLAPHLGTLAGGVAHASTGGTGSSAAQAVAPTNVPAVSAPDTLHDGSEFEKATQASTQKGGANTIKDVKPKITGTKAVTKSVGSTIRMTGDEIKQTPLEPAKVAAAPKATGGRVGGYTPGDGPREIEKMSKEVEPSEFKPVEFKREHPVPDFVKSKFPTIKPDLAAQHAKGPEGSWTPKDVHGNALGKDIEGKDWSVSNKVQPNQIKTQPNGNVRVDPATPAEQPSRAKSLLAKAKAKVLGS